MNQLFKVSQNYSWIEEKHGALSISFIGRTETIRKIIDILPKKGIPDPLQISQCLAELPGHFAILISDGEWALAVADKLASYPIFYYYRPGSFQASNSARLLQNQFDLREKNTKAFIELRTASYVTGVDTLFQNLYKLRAGELVLWNLRTSVLTRHRYYSFFSSDIRCDSENDLIDDLDARTNVIIDRHIKDAGDLPIVVPLSGGLDSRTVLAKLKIRGCQNLWAFSYGVPGNYDAKVAKYVADQIGVPWEFIPTTRDEAKKFFFSIERRNYWDYADGLHVVPNLHAFLALKTLKDSGRFENGAILINGQSGDFIAGDHIPQQIVRNTVSSELLLTNIISKHYSQRRSLILNQTIQESVRNRIKSVLEMTLELDDSQRYAKFHELWEWQTRQSIRVLNGQRNYDYLGISWELPLWETEYLDFWARIPLAHKLGRNLFKRWLEREDYFGLFRNYQPFMSRWPNHLIWIQHFGRGLRLFLGPKVSGNYYSLLDYFSQYSYLYADVSYAEYLSHYNDYRGTYPHYVNVWEKENKNMFTNASNYLIQN